jgi:hypothetical protein
VPDTDGPTHAYMPAAPGCWALYGEVLAREYEERAWAAGHRLAVDAYAVEHAGSPDRRNRQSAVIHLMSLCLILERGGDETQARRVLSNAARGAREWPALKPPDSFALTVVDVRAAGSAAEHLELVRRWAEGAWVAWEREHDRVRAWLSARG